MTQGVVSRRKGSCLKLVAAEIDIACGGINQFDKFISRTVATTIVIRVAGKAVRRIRKNFINHYVAECATTK